MFRIVLNMLRIVLNMFRIILNMFRIVLNMFRIVLNMFRIVLNMFRIVLNRGKLKNTYFFFKRQLNNSRTNYHNSTIIKNNSPRFFCLAFVSRSLEFFRIFFAVVFKYFQGVKKQFH
jgi:hypothetical protein